jgi:translation initiation factor 4E
MKRILNFPKDTKIDWKSHDASIQQRTAIDDARGNKSNQHNHQSSITSRNGAKDDYSHLPDKKQAS